MAQARNWSEMQVRVQSLKKKVEEIPAPPQPNDSWSEKMNNLNRCIEGIVEQVRTQVEQEDMRLAEEEEE